MNVADLMTRDVLTISPDALLKEVAATFLARGISGAPVCDAEGHVLGVIAKTDLLRGSGRGRTAADVMTCPAITAPTFVSPGTAAHIMLEHGVHRLPIVQDDTLVGILTQTDLVGAFALSDNELAAAIVDELRWQLPDLPAAERDRPTIEVTNGAVTVRGHVRRRSDIHVIERVVRRIPGVVSITTDVSWTVDDRRKHVAEGSVAALRRFAHR
jgi:predicted transcriptional regulator